MRRVVFSLLFPMALHLAAVAPGSACDAPVATDFSAALEGLMFDPATVDGNGDSSGAGNGLLDAAEMALVAAVLADPTLDLSAGGGVAHAPVAAAYRQALASVGRDVAMLAESFPTAAEAILGYVMIGTDASFEAIASMSTAFGAPLEGAYGLARSMGPHFGPDGDADGDGFTNRQEYFGAIDQGVAAYVKAALDPAQVPGSGPGSRAEILARAEASKRSPKVMKVGIVLYPGFEVLDVYGPVEMWGYVEEFELVTVAEAAGPVRSTQGLVTIAEHSFDDAPPLDIVMVPGGIGTFREQHNEAFLGFLRRSAAAAEVVTSVCTGSVLLAKAGLLDGRKATSNKLHFHLAREASDAVEWVEQARWVDDGKFVTSSGVSAGIDMALHLVERLYGPERAEQIAQWTETIRTPDPNNDPFAPSIGKHGGLANEAETEAATAANSSAGESAASASAGGEVAGDAKP